MSAKKKVLVISYFFPPLGGAGVQRSVKFCKYLPDHGWEPAVLTTNENTYYYAYDSDLLSELPPTVEIRRATSLEPKWLFGGLTRIGLRQVKSLLNVALVPDGHVGWLPFAFLAGLRTIKTSSIDLIFSTSAPYTAHLVAYFLKSVTGKPWVADFRDEWSRNPQSIWLTPVHRFVARKLERMVIRRADSVVAVTEPIARQLAMSLGGSASIKFKVITNGFDAEDLRERHPVSFSKDKMTMVHTGLFKSPRGPDTLLASLSELVAEGKIDPSRIELVFMGHEPHVDIPENLDGSIRLTGHVPHREAVAFQTSADVLLLLLTARREENRLLSAKVFEYLAAKKPILALVPECSLAADLIRKTRSGTIASPDSTEQIKVSICRLYDAWQNEDLNIDPASKEIAKYERGRLTAELAKLFDSLVENQRHEGRGLR